MKTSLNNISPLRRSILCPECGKPSDQESHPFCSEHCRHLDLGRWLNGSYAIPVSEVEENLEPEKDESQNI